MSEEDVFQQQFAPYLNRLVERVTTQTGDWAVKGFIDVYQNIYGLSTDTKVLSKVLELLIWPVIAQFAEEKGYRLVPARQQNHYPDVSLVAADGACYALDIKTTYRTGADTQGRVRVNGMTLGTFGGYFRARDSLTNIAFPYNRYARHYVLGAVYTPVRSANEPVERRVYPVHQLAEIPSVASDFAFFLHEKYRIASDRVGSGNTKNIGSSIVLDRLLNGTGVFAELGVHVFDDYWMNYRTRAMAREDGLATQPYRSPLEYRQYKAQGAQILGVPDDQRVTETDEEEAGDNASRD